MKLAALLITILLGGCATLDQPTPPPMQTNDCPLEVNRQWPCEVIYQ